MRKFIKIGIVFMLPIFVFGIVFEVMLRQIPNPYKVKTTYLETNRNSIETLILGSSHTQYGINPDFISNNALNFANVSQTIDIDYEILNYFEPKLINLKYVIIRLSYATLYEQLGATNENWRLKEYNIYTPLSLDSKIKHQFEILSVKLDTNINRILEYYVFDKYEVNATEKGWGIEANSKKDKDLLRTGLAVARKHTITDKSLYEENIDYLNKIVKHCQNQNIQIFLITTPAYKSYASNLDKKQLEATIMIGEQMDSKYNNCYYYNLLSSSKFTEADFFDSNHLNEKGAEKLTKFINQEMLNLDKF